MDQRRFASLFLCAATVIPTSAQNLTTLFTFDFLTSGGNPSALVQATDGNFYGTTSSGGTYFAGTIFQITPAGVFATLYSFPSASNEYYPATPLIQATDGNLWGATSSGGTHNSGTIFKITLGGTLTTVYNFGTTSTDGDTPAGLVQGTDGNIYGTTIHGGASSGTVFKITLDGTLTTLHIFCANTGCGDGQLPMAGLTQGSDGSFYGTTSAGGTSYPGNGTVYKITPGGMVTILYTFGHTPGLDDGIAPSAGLALGTDGNFYGTTNHTVFKINPAGTLTTLYSFNTTEAIMRGTLIQATDRNFYGATYNQGANNVGSVFQMSTAGALTTFYSFDSASGYFPQTGVI